MLFPGKKGREESRAIENVKSHYLSYKWYTNSNHGCSKQKWEQFSLGKPLFIFRFQTINIQTYICYFYQFKRRT